MRARGRLPEPRAARRDGRAGRGLPVPVAVLAWIGVAFLAAPLVAMIVRTPWSRLVAVLVRPEVLDALRLSVIASVMSLLVGCVLGLPLAWLFARTEFPGKRLVRAVCVLPMVLPPVVGGFALLLAFGRRGVFGRSLDAATGLTLPFTTAGVVVAATFVAMPFLVVAVEAGLRGIDPELERAAATLGADRWTVFRRVTLPLAAPAVRAGMAVCWARALGEFGATITFAGSLPGRTQTMPLAIFLQLETDRDAAIVMSLLLLGVSIAVLVALRERYLGAAPGADREAISPGAHRGGGAPETQLAGGS